MPSVENLSDNLDSNGIEFRIEAGSSLAFRFTSAPTVHIAVECLFEPLQSEVALTIFRYSAGLLSGPTPLGTDTKGIGRRMLSVFDAGPPTSYEALITSSELTQGTIRIVRTHFSDTHTCEQGCDDLLQLPLPIDPTIDGYMATAGTLFRYQFGRRDLILLVRYAARQMRKTSYGPIIPLDLSQWDGQTPGVDVGKPRHNSHQRGRDIDISLYDNAAIARLRPFCSTKPAPQTALFAKPLYSDLIDLGAASSALVCQRGEIRDFNAYAMAKLLGLFFSSQRIHMVFLDQELLSLVRGASLMAYGDGLFDAAVLKLFSDGVHLQPWPNHVDHLHVRVVESAPLNATGHPLLLLLRKVVELFRRN